MANDIQRYPSISSAAARRLLDGLLGQAAGDGGKPVAIAVVDDRGDLLAFGRLDGAPVRSTAIAINKAYTASRVRQSTAELAATLQRSGRSIAVYTDPRFTDFPGGVPLTTDEGTVVGAVGVSGRLPEEDDALAAAWQAYLQLGEG